MKSGRVGCANCDKNVTPGCPHKTIRRENYWLAFELFTLVSVSGTYLGQKDHTYFASQGTGSPCCRPRKEFVNWLDLRKVKRKRKWNKHGSYKLWLKASKQFDYPLIPNARGSAALSPSLYNPQVAFLLLFFLRLILQGKRKKREEKQTNQFASRLNIVLLCLSLPFILHQTYWTSLSTSIG